MTHTFRLATALGASLISFVDRPNLAAQNTLSEAEKKAGWKLLFDGKTMSGWRNFAKTGLGDGWIVKDGAICWSKRRAGDIVTVEQFDSFELSIEYKISQGGNSGIMFHVTEQAPTPWQTGPEVQIQDNVHGHDPQKSGWLYQLYQPKNDPLSGNTIDATRPVGHWNQIQLRVTPASSEINLNGIRYASFQKGDKNWDRRVARSKFSKYPLFGKPTRGHICLQDHGNAVSFRNIKVRELPASGQAPNPIDGTLPFELELAFPKLKWVGWEPEDERGLPQPLRPIILTHAGDGSDRIFVATQRGVIHVFENDSQVLQSKVFLDIRDRVTYKDNQNEEGFLGLAFHPKYEKNGQFFIYYTTKHAPHTSIISRFRVSKHDSDEADPGSEQKLLRIEQPFWNHDGGTLVFGPDGYLYIGLGDGGSANDPYANGQNLATLLGSILRIDVDRKDPGKAYAVPKDNPFVGIQGARPEIHAYGVRNVWRMSFDSETGTLWAGDVGQNLWEEIDLIVKGGNYGWNLRESRHPFGRVGSKPKADVIEPIWEYDHQVGKSITGGMVYRGRKFPELIGKYLYADYVSGKIWALDYDEANKKVISNQAIPNPTSMPIISFGEDESGEAYLLTVKANGKGIYRFARTANQTARP